MDTALKKEHEEDKLSILDVNLKTKTGMQINIEIQLINKRDFERRTLYYSCKRFIGQLGEGDPYWKLTHTVSINIIDFNLFPYDKYHNTYWMMEESEGTKLTDILRIDYLEMQKAKSAKETGVKQLWMDFLNAETEAELTMLAEKDAVFTKPIAEVIRLSGSEAVRAEYEMRQKAIRDRMAEIELGEERGMAKGMAEGKMEGIIMVAKTMKSRGIPSSEIALNTGLSLDEINAL